MATFLTFPQVKHLTGMIIAALHSLIQTDFLYFDLSTRMRSAVGARVATGPGVVDSSAAFPAKAVTDRVCRLKGVIEPFSCAQLVCSSCLPLKNSTRADKH